MIWSMYLQHMSVDSESRHIMKFQRTCRRKKAVIFLNVFLLVISLSGCRSESSVQEQEEKIQVVTTIFPQYDFVRQIAGEQVEVSMLLKPGEETHSYEPTPRDILKIQNCDLFIYVGGENDEWVEEILESIDTEKFRMLRLIDCVDTVNEEHVEGMKEERGHNHGEEEHEHEEEDHGSHKTLTPDEHVWTSPENAMEIVKEITKVLAELDPAQKPIYEKNERAYLDRLEALDKEFRTVVSTAKRDVLLFGDRFPFRYFADAYDLKYYAAFPGCASDTEPSAATMAFLIRKVEQEHIPVILKMELSNENIANAIAETTGAKVKTFYSCHNLTAKEFAQGETYLSMMKKNVQTLKEALN